MRDEIHDRSASVCERDCAHFKKSDFPLASAHGFHDSRKSIVEHRNVVDNVGHNGGTRSALSTQDVGQEWRRRQRREGTGVSGGSGVD